MFSRTQKKKKHPVFAISVAALAVFGGWSAITMAKEFCKEKARMLTKVVKKHKKCVCDDSNENSCLDD